MLLPAVIRPFAMLIDRWVLHFLLQFPRPVLDISMRSPKNRLGDRLGLT